jgi:integrase
LDEVQLDYLLEVAQGTLLELPVLLAATTGMRRGEIVALRWQDVDLDAGRISVSRSVEKTRDGGLRIKEPKSARGRRMISLPAMTVDALRAQKQDQLARKLLLGRAYEDNDLVCPQADGALMSPDVLTARFPTIVRRASLPHMWFHDLRHTHATLLLRAGVHPKIVSERLGHSTVSLTLDTYSHVLPSLQDEVARKLDAAFGRAHALRAAGGEMEAKVGSRS